MNEENEVASIKEISLGFRSRMKLKNTWADTLADFLTTNFGTVSFLIGNALFFVIWIGLNTGHFIPIEPFDPYPFGFLTMIVSLEAIALSIIVLISQNRASKIADLREEMHFEINVRAEEEVTRILNMVDEIHDHLGLDPEDDDELTSMKKKTNIEELGQEILREEKRNHRRFL